MRHVRSAAINGAITPSTTARCHPDLLPGPPVTVRIVDGVPHAETR